LIDFLRRGPLLRVKQTCADMPSCPTSVISLFVAY
jgi:hypothetical protein